MLRDTTLIRDMTDMTQIGMSDMLRSTSTDRYVRAWCVDMYVWHHGVYSHHVCVCVCASVGRILRSSSDALLMRNTSEVPRMDMGTR